MRTMTFEEFKKSRKWKYSRNTQFTMRDDWANQTETDVGFDPLVHGFDGKVYSYGTTQDIWVFEVYEGEVDSEYRPVASFFYEPMTETYCHTREEAEKVSYVFHKGISSYGCPGLIAA